MPLNALPCSPDYPHGITIVSPFGSDKKQVFNFCAQSAEELLKFVEDLKESIAEVSEMEQIRIECEYSLRDGLRPAPLRVSGCILPSVLRCSSSRLQQKRLQIPSGSRDVTTAAEAE